MRRLALLTLAAALIVAAPAAAASSSSSSKTKYVVSLGDSFSAGVQPGPTLGDDLMTVPPDPHLGRLWRGLLDDGALSGEETPCR